MKKIIKKITGISFVQNSFLEIQKKLNSIEKQNDEILWANIFNSSIANSEWMQNTSFSPGRWAAGYPFLYIIFRVIDSVKPKNILEFGLGESSKMTLAYLKSSNEVRLKIVEHDEKWVNYFNNNHLNIKENTIILPLESTYVKGAETTSYHNLIDNLVNEKYDFIIVDGPFGSKNYSRHQIVEIANNQLLNDEFVIIMDDYDRAGEKETVENLKESLNTQNVKYSIGFYSGVKSTCIICSDKYSYLTSL